MHGFKSNRIVSENGTHSGILVIDGAKIHDILPYDASVTFPVYDLGGLAILPGIIDPHVHVNEPGRTDWEGFDTATKSAASGGVTTIIDMPLNASPVTTTAEAFDEKLESTSGKCHVNVGFWGGIIPGNADQVEPLINKGVRGFKCFLTHSGIDEFPNATEEDLRKVMPIIAKNNLPLLAHCELSEDSDYWSGKDVRSYTNYLNSRPKKWEDDAVSMMLRLSEEFQCRVHIVHLSSSTALPEIKKYREKGTPVTLETGQHYLYFDAEAIPDGNTAFKCAPPIREKKNNDALWQALSDGLIDLVATDHSPAPPEIKEITSGDFSKAWGGIASLQFAFSVMWTAMKARQLPIDLLVKWMSQNPAKLIGYEHQKGQLKKGRDADFFIADLEAVFTVTEELIQHKHKVTPYIDQQLTGLVHQTWIAGINVYKNGRFTQYNSGKII